MPRKILVHRSTPKLPSFRGKFTETAGAVKRAAPDSHDNDDDKPEGSSKRPRVVSTPHAQDHDHDDIRYDDGDDHDNFNYDSGSISSGDLDLDLGGRIGVVSLLRSTLNHFSESPNINDRMQMLLLMLFNPHSTTQRKKKPSNTHKLTCTNLFNKLNTKSQLKMTRTLSQPAPSTKPLLMTQLWWTHLLFHQ